MLSAENKKQLWLAVGFTYRFMVLLDTIKFHYKPTDYWALDFEYSITWNDTTIDSQWHIHGDPILSAKDRQAKPSAGAEHLA